MSTEENKPYVGEIGSESENCKFVGHIVLGFCIVVGVVYIFVFGKVDTIRYSEYAGEIKHSAWSVAQIMVGISIGLSGLFWWYIIQKIGSILGHLESMKQK